MLIIFPYLLFFFGLKVTNTNTSMNCIEIQLLSVYVLPRFHPIDFLHFLHFEDRGLGTHFKARLDGESRFTMLKSKGSKIKCNL